MINGPKSTTMRNGGRNTPIAAIVAPASPATRYPTNTAVITTGPGVIMPIATASRNSRSDSQPKSWTTPCWRNGTIARPDPNVNAPALKKKIPIATSVAGSADPAAASKGEAGGRNSDTDRGQGRYRGAYRRTP